MIEIRPATDGDREQVIVLIREVFGEEQAERAARRWEWQWHADPRLDTPGYKGVVALWRDRVIANLACIPAALHISGSPVRAHWCVDVLSHFGLLRQALREHKRSRSGQAADLSRGVAAALLDHPAAGPIQLAKHISDPMLAICRRIGFEDLPHSGNFARRLSFRESLRTSVGSMLGGMVAFFADVSIRRVPSPTLQVAVFDGRFDDRFDRLWEQVRNRYAAITLRDSASLNWRYKEHPDTAYYTLVVEKGVEIRGYLVVSVYLHGGRLRARVADLLTTPGDARVVDDLIAGACRFARSRGADRIECFASGPLVEAGVRRLGFEAKLKKSSKPQPLIHRRFPLAELHATAGDGDGA